MSAIQRLMRHGLPHVADAQISRFHCLISSPSGALCAWRMIQRRAAEFGTRARIGCHTFRATGITAYLEAGGTLENAQAMAAHDQAL